MIDKQKLSDKSVKNSSFDVVCVLHYRVCLFCQCFCIRLFNFTTSKHPYYKSVTTKNFYIFVTHSSVCEGDRKKCLLNQKLSDRGIEKTGAPLFVPHVSSLTFRRSHFVLHISSQAYFVPSTFGP